MDGDASILQFRHGCGDKPQGSTGGDRCVQWEVGFQKLAVHFAPNEDALPGRLGADFDSH